MYKPDKPAETLEEAVVTFTKEPLKEGDERIQYLSDAAGFGKTEQKLMRQLAAAGAIDLETAVLIARIRMQDKEDADVTGVIEQLKKEKQYLFNGSNHGTAPMKTAGARDRVANSQTLLERAAKKAAATGSRTDLHEYLKLRRNFL